MAKNENITGSIVHVKSTVGEYIIPPFASPENGYD